MLTGARDEPGSLLLCTFHTTTVESAAAVTGIGNRFVAFIFSCFYLVVVHQWCLAAAVAAVHPFFQPLLLKIVVMANHHHHRHHHHHRSCGGGGDHRGESIALAKRSIERKRVHSGRKCYYSTAAVSNADIMLLII